MSGKAYAFACWHAGRYPGMRVFPYWWAEFTRQLWVYGDR